MNTKARSLLAVVGVIGIVVGLGYLFLKYRPLLEEKFLSQKKNTRFPQARYKSKPSLTVFRKAPLEKKQSKFSLKGILFWQGKGVALLNDQIVKEGDTILDAEVMRITLSEVELATKTSNISLATNGTVVELSKKEPSAVEIPLPKAVSVVRYAPEKIEVMSKQEAVEVQPSPAATKEYTVAEGDSLWKIAEKELGDGKQWMKLYELNKEKIANPHALKPGTKLLIPEVLEDNH